LDLDRVLGFILYWVLRLYFSTLRVSFENYSLYNPNKTLIGFWHQDMLMALFISKKSKGLIFTVDTFTGKNFKNMAERFGFEAFEIDKDERSKKTIRAVKNFVEKIRLGRDGGIALDGFKKPFKVDKGLAKLIIAKTSGLNYLKASFTYSFKVVNILRQDHLIFPFPFTKVRVSFKY